MLFQHPTAKASHTMDKIVVHPHLAILMRQSVVFLSFNFVLLSLLSIHHYIQAQLVFMIFHLWIGQQLQSKILEFAYYQFYEETVPIFLIFVAKFFHMFAHNQLRKNHFDDS